MRGIFFAPAASIVNVLFGLIERRKSIFEPFFKNLGPNPANGPNNKESSLFIRLLSKCGTVIGGVPFGSLPYTFASCCCTISGLVQTKNSPLIGKPPMPLLSGIFVFCNKG